MPVSRLIVGKIIPAISSDVKKVSTDLHPRTGHPAPNPAHLPQPLKEFEKFEILPVPPEEHACGLNRFPS